MKSQPAPLSNRTVVPYDPRTHFAEAYPDWTLVVQPDLSARALVSIPRRTILLDRASWAADRDGLLAHVLAMLDLDLVPVDGGEADRHHELIASGLARVRLDRQAFPEGDALPEAAENR